MVNIKRALRAATFRNKYVIPAGSFTNDIAEPADGGNMIPGECVWSGDNLTLYPRWQVNEAISGNRWHNFYFAVRGVKGRTINFQLPLKKAGGSGALHHASDSSSLSYRNMKPVWSYSTAEPRTWKLFDNYVRYKYDGSATPDTGFPTNSVIDETPASTTVSSTHLIDYAVTFSNSVPFAEDVVYISNAYKWDVTSYYDWLRTVIFPSRFCSATASEEAAGTFRIGTQAGATGSTGFTRTIPETDLFGFILADPAQTPTKTIILMSGQHPYEGGNKFMFKGFVDYFMTSQEAAAVTARSRYRILCYPHVNPTGELAGLWRGTAYSGTVAGTTSKDTNRNWHTTQTDPATNQAIDTVIIHKAAYVADIEAIGNGAADIVAAIDLHQGYGVNSANYANVISDTGKTAAFIDNFQAYYALQTELSSLSTGFWLNFLRNTDAASSGWGLSDANQILCTFESDTYNTDAELITRGEQTLKAIVDTNP